MGIFTEFIDIIRYANKNVKWFMFCVFMNGIIMSVLSVMLGIYYTNINLSEGAIGSLLSVRTFGVSIGAIFAIMLVHVLGSKKSLYVSFFVMIISGFCFVNITYMPLMQIASFLFGAAQAVFVVMQAPFYKKNSNDQTVVGIFSASFVLNNLAMFTGSFVFGKLSDILAEYGGIIFGSKSVLNIGIVLLCISLFAVYKIEFEAPLISKNRKAPSFKDYLSVLNRDGILYLLKMALIGLGAGMVVPFFSVYIKASLNASDGVVGSIMAFSQFGTVLGGLLVPVLSRRIGRVRLVLVCQLLSIPFLFSITFPQGAVVMAISFFFRNTLMNMANPILQGMAMDIVEEKNRTIMSSIFSLTDNLFRALGTQAGGFLMMAVSYNTPYYFTMLFYLLSTVVIYFLFGKNEKYKKLN